MLDRTFCFSVFAVLENITKSELTNTSRALVVNYIEEADGTNYADKARAAIFRYANAKFPSLDEIRKKAETSGRNSLTILEHLILKMEFQATRVR